MFEFGTQTGLAVLPQMRHIYNLGHKKALGTAYCLVRRVNSPVLILTKIMVRWQLCITNDLSNSEVPASVLRWLLFVWLQVLE